MSAPQESDDAVLPGQRVLAEATPPRGSDFERNWRERFEQYGLFRNDDAGIAGWSASGLGVRFRRFRGLWDGASPGERWLDVGCGAGTYARLLSSAGLEVMAFDYSLPTLQQARARCGSGLSYAVADVKEIPLPTGSVDGALCFGVMQALSSPRPALDELARVIRPGGRLWIDALCGSCLPTRWKVFRAARSGRPLHLRYDGPESLAAAVEAAGFRHVKLHWIPILPGRLARLQRLVERSVVVGLFARAPWIGRNLSHAFSISGERAGAGAR